MSTIKSISIVSENLSQVVFTPEDLEYIRVSGISQELNNFGGELHVGFTCSELALHVKQEANQIIGAPFVEYGTIFNLLHQDHCVTSIVITYEENEFEDEDVISVPYNGDMCNECMDTKITDDGDLLLVVSYDNNVDTIFCDGGSYLV